MADQVLRALSNLVEARPEAQADGDESGEQRVSLFSLIEEHGRGVRLADGESLYEKRLPNLHLLVADMPPNIAGLPSSIDFGVRFDEGRANETASSAAVVHISLPAAVIKKVLDDNPGTKQNEVYIYTYTFTSQQLNKAPPPSFFKGSIIMLFK